MENIFSPFRMVASGRERSPRNIESLSTNGNIRRDKRGPALTNAVYSFESALRIWIFEKEKEKEKKQSRPFLSRPPPPLLLLVFTKKSSSSLLYRWRETIAWKIRGPLPRGKIRVESILEKKLWLFLPRNVVFQRVYAIHTHTHTHRAQKPQDVADSLLPPAFLSSLLVDRIDNFQTRCRSLKPRYKSTLGCGWKDRERITNVP